jgi:hypothetical protein
VPFQVHCGASQKLQCLFSPVGTRRCAVACLLARSERLALRGLRADTADMEKKPEPTKPVLGDIYVSVGGAERGDVGMLVGTVEAADENDAVGKAPARLKQYGRKLMAVRHKPNPSPFRT